MKPHLQTPLPPLIGMVILLLVSSFLNADASAPIARSGCQDTCGNVSIPFPWGIGTHCFLDTWFEIQCRHSNGSTKPFLSKLDVEVVKIVVADSTDGSESAHVTMRIPPVSVCSTADTQVSSVDLKGGPYVYMVRDNVFVMEGCAGSAVLVDQSNATIAGCATVCHSNDTTVKANDCYGVKCCHSPPTYTSSHDPFTSYKIDFNPQLSSGGGQNCLMGTLIESDSLNQYVGKLSSSDPSGAAPVSLSWSWISEQRPDVDPHATCSFDESSNTTMCSCNQDSVGSNPYVSGGCQVAEECKTCDGVCYRTGNSYNCYVKTPLSKAVAAFGLVLGLGMVALAVSCYGLYHCIKRRRKVKRKAKFFKRNGGLLLEQQLSSNEGVIERTKVFTSNELKKATDNFHENRILGQGGQGTVYKGMLTDGRIVAIKKSKLLDESQLEQFVNEVVILSQINHRHVVKIFGCCLETEVPLLVYEFIPSGTLFQHIHNPDEDSIMSWATRLKVATDSAGAIAYLHSSSATPIYHRDIKSSNILLDDKNRAKVSDFGSSKTIAIDQTHLSTLVQGTMGYLDPEYFQSYQFTEKSDVYSFGVVLLELLTGKKPIYMAENMEQQSLVSEFQFMMENSRLYDIVDPTIVKKVKDKELMIVADLAKRCVSWKGMMRPTMKEVAMTLEMIIRSPVETSTQDEQGFPSEELRAIFMPETSEIEFN